MTVCPSAHRFMSLTLSTHSFPCHLFVCQSRIYPLTHPSIHLPNKPWLASYPSKHPSVHTSIYLPSIHLIIRPSAPQPSIIYPDIHPFMQPSTLVSVYLSICPSSIMIHQYVSTRPLSCPPTVRLLSSALSRGGLSSLQEPF